MNGDPKAGAGGPPSVAESGIRGQIVELLLRDGVLDASQLRHAERVRERLAAPRPVVPLLLELGLLRPEALQETLRRHRLGLRIGALLVELGHLPEAAVETALRVQRETAEPERKLGEILVSQGALGARELAEVLSSQLGVPCAAEAELDGEPALLERTPLEVCQRHRFLPLRREGGKVLVAFADPLDKEDAAAAQSYLGAELSPRIVATHALDEALSRLELSARVAASSGGGEDAVSRVLHDILGAALRLGASHVHVESAEKRVRIRLRRDGVLHPWRDLPGSLLRPLLRLVAREAGIAAEEGEGQREGSLCLETGGVPVTSHAAFLRCGHEESLTLTLPRAPAGVLGLDALGLLPSMRRRLEDGPLAAPGSLLLVAGPPRSGRRTTLRACASQQGEGALRVVALDDPGSARAEGAALAGGRLEAALRQDPDVLVLGVLRQPSDLAAALRATRSGARVLAALEAEDAVAGLHAAAGSARAAGLLLPALTAVMAQRLVRRVCDGCAHAEAPAAAALRRLGCTPVDVAGGGFRRGRGCARCGELGAVGRIGVFELHVFDELERDHVMAGQEAAALRRGAARIGPATLLEEGLLKAAHGLVPVEELVRVLPRSQRPRGLADLIRMEGEER